MRLVMLLVLVGPVMADTLQPLEDSGLSDVTGQAGLTFNANVKVNSGDVAYVDAQNSSRPVSERTPNVVFDNLAGQIAIKNSTVDLFSNASGKGVQFGLPSEVRFTNFGPQAVYLSSNTSIGTPPALSMTPKAPPTWSQEEKTYYVVVTSDKWNVGQNDSYGLWVSHGKLEAANTERVDSLTIKPDNQYLEFKKNWAWAMAQYPNYPWNSNSSPDRCSWPYDCNNVWFKWTLKASANAALHLGSSSPDIGQPYLLVVDPSITPTGNGNNQVVAQSGGHTSPVGGFWNENPSIFGVFGNDATNWGGAASTPSGDRYLLDFNLNGRFAMGGSVRIRP